VLNLLFCTRNCCISFHLFPVVYSTPACQKSVSQPCATLSE